MDAKPELKIILDLVHAGVPRGREGVVLQ